MEKPSTEFSFMPFAASQLAGNRHRHSIFYHSVSTPNYGTKAMALHSLFSKRISHRQRNRVTRKVLGAYKSW